MSFHENFKTARKKNGFTQQQLAEILGLNRTSISKYESGDVMPNVKTIVKICELFNMTFEELYEVSQ